MNILQRYESLISIPSDINEHLPVLFALAQEVDSIAELGTRNCNSTTAFMAAIVFSNKELFCYDLYRSDLIDEFEKFENFNFFQADTLEIDLPNIDLLFIDTLHTYFQLKNELSLHAKNVSKYIVLHDTKSYAYGDESFYSESEYMIMSKKVKQEEKRGLVPAISDFLETEEGNKWIIEKVYENNNGLTILKRQLS
jgi:hypothetical protein